MARHRAKPAHRTWPQRLLIVVGILTTTACVAAGGFVLSVYVRLGQLVHFNDVNVEEAAAGEPENFLIVGSDSRDNIDPDDPNFADVLPNSDVGGTRSDTIMVARIDPQSEHVDMLSFPRDLWVEIPGVGESRINAAYGVSRQTLIDTISQDFGIDIHHYVEVDFTGFQRLVSSLGGIPVYLDTKYRDRQSGMGELGPGCWVLDGDQALAFARSRHLEYATATRWITDPTGDLGRITRQQFLIRRALEQVLELNLTDLVTLNRLLDVGIESVGVDPDLSVDDLRGLASRFSDFDPDTIRNHPLPTEPFRTSGGAAVLRLVDEQAQQSLNLFRGLPPGAATPSQVFVEVQNGSGVEQQATNTAEALTAVGFQTAVNRDAPEPAATTTVHFGPGSEEAARLLARHLTSKATFVEDDSLSPLELRLVTGADFTSVVIEPWPDSEVLAPTTTTTVPEPGDEGSSTTPTTLPPTTTTVVGVLPESPPPGEEC